MKDLELWLTVTNIAVSLGTVAAVGAYGRFVWNRWRWRRFKRAVLRELDTFVEERAGEEIVDDDLIAFGEECLNDAGFTPFESVGLITIAIAAVKSSISFQEE